MESVGLESPDDQSLSQIWSTFERSSGAVVLILKVMANKTYLLQALS